jgi:hypothetical protein
MTQEIDLHITTTPDVAAIIAYLVANTDGEFLTGLSFVIEIGCDHIETEDYSVDRLPSTLMPRLRGFGSLVDPQGWSWLPDTIGGS